jgi:Tetratricopeptide repeat
MLLKDEGDVAGAETWLRTAAPGEMKAAYELGELLLAEGRPAEAKDAFEQAFAGLRS